MQEFSNKIALHTRDDRIVEIVTIASWGKITARVILPLAEYEWLK